MLLGNKPYVQFIIKLAEDYAHKNSWHIIGLTNIGSLIRGTYKYNSDYDIVVLYLPENKEIKTDIFTKKILNDNIEITYCNAELAIDYLCGDYKGEYIIYYEIIESFMSPFLYDPVGIINKEKTILCLTVNYKNIIQAYLNHIDFLFNFNKEGEEVNIKRILTLIYIILYTDWLLKNEQLPICHIQLLKTYNCNDKLKELTETVIVQNKKWSEEMQRDKKNNYTHYSYKLIIPSKKELEILENAIKDLHTNYVKKIWTKQEHKPVSLRKLWKESLIEKKDIENNIIKMEGF